MLGLRRVLIDPVLPDLKTPANALHLAVAVSLVALLGCVAQPPATGQTAGKGMVSMEALQGKSWVLAQFDNGDDGSKAPAEGAITAVFAAGKVSGSGGCNRYSASVTSPSPGALKVGPVSATKRFCLGAAGENEQRYFAALAKATGYAIEDGRLVLTWDREGQSPGRLVFRAGG
ncbi:MAG: META domain-containing protein [Acidobacteria bacterium]|nr:META domain-containing protein [Acidobacteriota bacterium]